jgi:catecholate siderophore receptor
LPIFLETTVSKNHEKKKRRTLTGRRAWLAMGTIAAYAATGSTKATLLVAQTDKGPRNGQAQLPVRRFDIPAGPLDVTLAEFAKLCGVTVKYSVPEETIPGFKSAGVSGLYSQEQALRQILTGTGLSFNYSGQDEILIGVRSAESVEVKSGVPDSIALAKFPAPLLDTPQSITAIPRQVLDQQGAITLRDALRNAPGISLAAGEGGSQGDNLTIRGFTARNDIFLDGMRDFGSYYRDPFNYEQVDVLEGPAGVDFGRGSTGGVVNQESKVPLSTPYVSVDGNLGTDFTRRFAADVNEPLPQLGNGTGFRLNVVGSAANVAQRDVTVNRHYGVAPTITFGMQSPNRLTASYFHLGEDDIPDYGIPWYFNKPTQVARHNYYGFSDLNYLRADVNIGTVKAEHDLGTHGILRNVTRYANYVRGARITEPQLNTVSSGSITPQTPLDQVLVNRNQIATDSTETFMWDQADASLTGQIFGMRHTGVVGVEGGRETSSPVRPTFYAPQIVNGKVASINTVPATSLLDPNEGQPFSGTPLPSSNVHASALSVGVYLLDDILINLKWELTGGIRWDRFDTSYNAVNWTYPAPGQTVVTPSQFQRVDEKPTWRGALVYKPKANGSVYFAYGTSFNPSAETLALSQGTANLPPEENQTYETGSKWDLRGGRLTMRGAFFRTDKENARETSPTNSALVVLSGNQGVTGAEFAMQGHITDRWELLSSYTFMHSEVVKSQFYPASVGSELPNVPENLFNIWTEYHLPRGWEVGGGGNFVDSRTASSTVPNDPTTGLPKEAPSYWVANAMAKYEISDRLSAQVNIFNLLDRNYIDQIHPGHLVPGAGTSALFGLKYTFR